jgi:hypothetical protein
MERAFLAATPEAEATASDKIYRRYASRMDKNGITDDYLAQKLKAGLTAKDTELFLQVQSFERRMEFINIFDRSKPEHYF